MANQPMRTSSARALRHTGICMLCAIVGWVVSDPLGPSEFRGGTVTGPLLAIHEVSGGLFVLSAVMTFVYRRTAAVIALIACLLSLPLYFYFTAPGVFRRVFPGEYTVPVRAGFVWDTWAVAGITAVAAAAYISLKGRDKPSPVRTA